MKHFNEYRVVISGAGGGIGSAIALEFAKKKSKLLISDINESANNKTLAECKKYTNDVVHFTADLSTTKGCHNLIDACIDNYGGIDVLVNIAGLLTQAPILDLTENMWDQMLCIDLKSIFLTTQRALPHMIKQKWGRIINISSQLGIKGGIELAHYAAAKAGVIGFTKSVAQEVAKHNVLVNAIAPGPISTPLVDGISESWKIEKAKELPLGRFGRAEEVAPSAILLASDPGGNLFVGQTLGPNSGDVMP